MDKQKYDEQKQKQESKKEAARKKAAKKNTIKKLAITGVVIAAIVGIFALAGSGSSNTPNEPLNITDSDHIKGPDNAPVTLLEYGDFQCPACGSAFPFVKQLSQEYPDNLRIVYRHFPLNNIHPRANIAAQATEAAALQGEFWQMHDLLFNRQQAWVNASDVKATLADYAEEIGLDKDQFLDDLESQEVAQAVQNDRSSALSLNVNSTPTFFVNGDKVQLQSFADLEQAVQEAIQDAPENSTSTPE